MFPLHVPLLVHDAATGRRTRRAPAAGLATSAAVSRAIEELLRIRRRVRKPTVPVVVVPYMGEVGGRLCERAEVSWTDLSGNARLFGPGLRVVVGGLVPALLTGSSETGESSRAYPGTVDLDLGLSLGVGDEIRLKQLAERFVTIGLRQLATVQRRPVRERWITQPDASARRVIVDLLIPPGNAPPGTTLVRPLPAGLAAFVVPGLELAFGDRVRVRVKGLSGTRCTGSLGGCALSRAGRRRRAAGGRLCDRR